MGRFARMNKKRFIAWIAVALLLLTVQYQGRFVRKR